MSEYTIMVSETKNQHNLYNRASGIANNDELVTASVIDPLVTTESWLVFDGQAKFIG